MCIKRAAFDTQTHSIISFASSADSDCYKPQTTVAAAQEPPSSLSSSSSLRACRASEARTRRGFSRSTIRVCTALYQIDKPHVCQTNSLTLSSPGSHNRFARGRARQASLPALLARTHTELRAASGTHASSARVHAARQAVELSARSELRDADNHAQCPQPTRRKARRLVRHLASLRCAWTSLSAKLACCGCWLRA